MGGFADVRFTRTGGECVVLDPQADVEMLEALERRRFENRFVWQRIAKCCFASWTTRFPT